MRRQLDVLVAPLRRPEVTRDDPRAVNALKVAEDERVASLRLVLCAVCQAKVPAGVVGPWVSLQERVLVVGFRLVLAPVAIDDIPASIDQASGVCHGAPVHLVPGHGRSGWRNGGSVVKTDDFLVVRRS